MKRLDDTGFGSLRIYQESRGFCYGTDAVLLAHGALSMTEKRPERVCDLGTGNGIVALILGKCLKEARILGVDIQEEAVSLARESSALNGMDDRIEFLTLGVEALPEERKDLKGSFDLVTVNPPYYQKGKGIPGGEEMKRLARHETSGTLEDFMRAADFLLSETGEAIMVHRPERLVDICEIARSLGLEPKEIRPVSGKPMEKANILILHLKKNGGRNLELLKPWAVRRENSEFTEEMLRVYEEIKEEADEIIL